MPHLELPAVTLALTRYLEVLPCWHVIPCSHVVGSIDQKCERARHHVPILLGFEKFYKDPVKNTGTSKDARPIQPQVPKEKESPAAEKLEKLGMPRTRLDFSLTKKNNPRDVPRAALWRVLGLMIQNFRHL